MLRLFPILLFAVLLPATCLGAAQSLILESEGYACMGDDRSRKETEHQALADARRNASEAAVSYLRSETRVEDGVLQKDLLSAYAQAQVTLLDKLLQEWYKDPAAGDCYRVKARLEVTPDEQALANLPEGRDRAMLDDPAAPLTVRVWTDRERYRRGERIQVFVKGNWPFYGRLVYRDAGGRLLQLLPNPFRKEHYFNGGTVYQVPAGPDRFELEVDAPYGSEQITLYASTAPLGELRLSDAGPVFAVRTPAEEVPRGSRGVKIVPRKNDTGRIAAAEFAEASCQLTTAAR